MSLIWAYTSSNWHWGRGSGRSQTVVQSSAATSFYEHNVWKTGTFTHALFQNLQVFSEKKKLHLYKVTDFFFLVMFLANRKFIYGDPRKNIKFILFFETISVVSEIFNAYRKVIQGNVAPLHPLACMLLTNQCNRRKWPQWNISLKIRFSPEVSEKDFTVFIVAIYRKLAQSLTVVFDSLELVNDMQKFCIWSL